MKSANPPFEKEKWAKEDRAFLLPFFSNIDEPIYTIRNIPPELAGALCSRASRAKGDLRRIFLEEYVRPILSGDDKALKKELKTVSEFFSKHDFRHIVNNQRAQQFFAKWLAQYGDESIMQMVGTYVVFSSISNVAVKFLEDQRVGVAPIEKSTRYVDFSSKVNGRYRFYTPPELEGMKLTKQYDSVMTMLFETYLALLPQLKALLMKEYPQESEGVLEKKAFDTLRGLLPMSTLTQVGFYGNAQAYDHMINRSAKFPLEELQWIAKTLKKELDEEIYSLLLRQGGPKAQQYHEYLGYKTQRIASWVGRNMKSKKRETASGVSLIEYDKHGEDSIIAAILFPEVTMSWKETLAHVKKFSVKKKKEVISLYVNGRQERWQRVGRALENIYMRFEIVMNIGAWRDLHRHRMQTQARQVINCHLGFDTPKEIKGTILERPFKEALAKAEKLFVAIEKRNPLVAQYAVPMAYRVRFYQYCNMRQLFWETELRTTSQGHPDYRIIEQEKYKLIKKVYPLVSSFMMVDMEDYQLARRGTEKRIEDKEKRLLVALKKTLR